MIPRSTEGGASLEQVFAGVDTVPALLMRRASLTPLADAYLTHENTTWKPLTWADFGQRVAAVREVLAGHEVGPGTRVAILARTSLGWEVAQLAALACGAIVVGIDPYYPDTLANALIRDLEVTVLLVDGPQALARIDPETRERLAFVASLGERSGADLPALEALVPRSEQATSSWTDAARPNGVAIVAFSSGSSGLPSPIFYTHAQVLHACRCILELYPELSPGTRLVCWLPLANLFQRMINFAGMALGAKSYLVEDPREVMNVLPIANPDIFVAVPRFCERLHAGIVARVRQKPLLRLLVDTASRVGRAVDAAQTRGQRPAWPWRVLRPAADRVVLSRVRAVMGTSIRFIVSGSAPMPRWLLDWYAGIGLPVLEAYGASENLVPIAANRLRDRKPGTVGKPVGDNEIRISDSGEVLVRGRGVFDPAIAENARRAAALTPDGFLATGDLGALDDAGFLTLYGRSSEVFKNAQGRWVSLGQIEAVLRRLPDVEHAAVIRLDDSELVGVLALVSASAETEEPKTRLADEQAIRERFAQPLQQELASLPRAMWPCALLFVRAGFSPGTGELTTNFKLRRNAIGRAFGERATAAAAEARRARAEGSNLPLLKVA